MVRMKKFTSTFLIYFLVLLIMYVLVQGAGTAFNYKAVCERDDTFVYDNVSEARTPRFEATKNWTRSFNINSDDIEMPSYI